MKKVDFFFTCDFRPEAQYFPGLKKGHKTALHIKYAKSCLKLLARKN